MSYADAVYRSMRDGMWREGTLAVKARREAGYDRKQRYTFMVYAKAYSMFPVHHVEKLPGDYWQLVGPLAPLHRRRRGRITRLLDRILRREVD